MIEGCTYAVSILCYIRLQLKLFIKGIITISQIVLKSFLRLSWNTIVAYIHLKVLICKIWCIVLFICFFVDGFNPVLRKLVDITINLIMYICILILERSRIDNFVSRLLALLLTLLRYFSIKLVLFLELDRICMLAGIFYSVICLHSILVSKIRELLIPCHGSVKIYRNYKFTLITVLIYST